MNPLPLKCALYVRVSTRDKGQSVENQLPMLRKFARERGFEVARVYEDYESGSEPIRPGFLRMMAGAKAGEFQVLIFWSLDRFTREGAYPTLEYLNTLSGYGVGVLSYTEQYLDTVGIFRDAIIAILGVIAQQERQRISERVKAGVARVREKNGDRPWGRRPKLREPEDLAAFAADSKRLTVDELAAIYHCSRAVVYRRLKLVRESTGMAA